MDTKFIFTIGGVLSGLGKGVTTASIGLLLKKKGFRVTAVKIDPYISIDAGTMRPAEHGETFVTADGGEIDQDLGNYERFLEIELGKENNITTGKAYMGVIEKERAFAYEGKDAQIFPDLINEIKERIYSQAEGYDFCLIEVGGTTGDLENMPFLHAAREIGRENSAAYIMVTYLPYLRNVGELKTKPTQHSVAALRSVGIFPDFIITRNEVPIDAPRKKTISVRCFIDEDRIIDNPDTDLIYKIPILFDEEKIADKLLKMFDLRARRTRLGEWKKFVRNLQEPKGTVRIGMVGKYFKHGGSDHKDVYISVLEAITHAGGNLAIKPEIIPVNSEDLEKDPNPWQTLAGLGLDGLIGPQGWGSRGTEGIMEAIRWARRHEVPYLGLCFGMQMAVIEYARSVAGIFGASSGEIDSKAKHKIIDVMPDQKEYLRKKQYGGTIRLGDWECLIEDGTLLEAIYREHGWIDGRAKQAVIKERHRHRYEVSNEYRGKLRVAGLVISGTSPDGKLVEAIELPQEKHPFFIATQFHPEYKSKPLSPHPLFVEFIKACSGTPKLVK